jgi:hypothetical protein
MGTTTRLNVLIGFAFVFVAFLFIYNQVDNLNEAAIQEERRSIQQDLFQDRVSAYTRSVSAFETCVETVALAAENREQWEDLVEIVRALGPNAEDLAERIAAGPLLTSLPRAVTDCPDPGKAPIFPEE